MDALSAVQGHDLPQGGRRTGSTVCPESNATTTSTCPPRERIAQLLDERQLRGVVHRPHALRPAWASRTACLTPSGSKAEQAKTGMRDAAVVGKGFIRGRPVVFGVTDFAFMAGSMGSVVGEKLTRAVEEADPVATAADLRQRLRRRGADAGGHPVADADGQGVRRPGALRPGRRAVHLDPDQPDHGRRGRQLRPPGRHHPGRARRPDRLCRQAHHLEHRPPGTARRTSRPASSCWSTASSTASSSGKDLRTELARIIDYCEHK